MILGETSDLDPDQNETHEVIMGLIPFSVGGPVTRKNSSRLATPLSHRMPGSSWPSAPNLNWAGLVDAKSRVDATHLPGWEIVLEQKVVARRQTA